MKIISKKELDAISNAIKRVEKHTDAELVAVLAHRSDNYHYIPTLWSAVISLLVPGGIWFSGIWLDMLDVLLLQLLTFICLAAIFRVPFILVRLIPPATRRWRAANMARRQFLENNLHHTRGESGILIFISETEHYVEIIADRGIDKYIDQSRWQEIVDDLIKAIKNRRTQQGLIACIEACGKLLQEHIPATTEKNELPNHLIVI